MLPKTLLSVALTAFTASANAQESFDFSRIPGVDQQPKVQIDLNPALLGFFKQAAEATDPRSASLFAGIESILVRVYELESRDDREAIDEFIDDATSALESGGWHRAVFVDEDESKVRVYIRLDGTVMDGMTVMVSGDDGETVFINVAGRIDPAQLGQVANQFGFGEIMGAFAPQGAAGFDLGEVPIETRPVPGADAGN